MALTRYDMCKEGTIFGVPFTFMVSTQEYLLPDGKKFDKSDYDKMYQYVSDNLPTFAAQTMKANSSIALLEKIRKTVIEEKNRKIQLDWDKKFNESVLRLVRIAIENGSAKWHYLDSSSLNSYNTFSVPDNFLDMEKNTVEIVYNRRLSKDAAYLDIREQAENAVRLSMKPPELLPLP